MTREEVLSKCLKEHGGQVLCVGGGIRDWNLPKSPLFIYWDDGSGGDKNINRWSIPSNIRGIAYGKWISHSTVSRLRNAANSLRIPIFPMLRAREMRELLHSVESQVSDHLDHVRDESKYVVSKYESDMPGFIEPPPLSDGEGIKHNEDAPAVLMKEDLLTKEEGEKQMSPKKQIAKRGQITALVASLDDPSLGPTISAKKIFTYAQEKGLVTTEASIAQSVYKYRKNTQPPISKALRAAAKATSSPRAKRKTVGKQVETDDMAQALSLINEAKAALELLGELLPKLSVEGDKIKKLRELLGV